MGRKKMLAADAVVQHSKIIGRSRASRGPSQGNRRRSAPIRAAAIAEHLENRCLLTAAPAPGALDPNFGTGGTVYNEIDCYGGGPTNHDIAVQSNGYVVQVFGSEPSAGPGYLNFQVNRYTAAGGIDTTFGTNGITRIPIGTYDLATGVAIQSNGKIVVAGSIQDSNGSYQVGVARLNSDGSIDTTFGNNGQEVINVNVNSQVIEVSNVAIQSDGKILITGDCADGLMAIRLNTNGSLDTSFAGGGLDILNLPQYTLFSGNGMAIMNNGDIVIAGQCMEVSTYNWDGILACLTPSGTLDTSFNGTGVETTLFGPAIPCTFRDVANDNGKIVVVGTSNGSSGAWVYRFNMDGTPDTTFNGTGESTVGNNYGSFIVVQNDGAIDIGLAQYMGVLRVGPTGALDTTFGTNGTTNDNAVNYQQDDSGLALSPGGTIVYMCSDGTYDSLARYFQSSAPTAVINGPYMVNTQASIGLSAAGSSDPTGQALTYAWDTNYNGSTFNPTLFGANPTFSAAGISGGVTRTLALEVTNFVGVPSPIVTCDLKIKAVPPSVTANASATSIGEGQSVALTGTVNDVDPNDTFTYDWHVTDNNGQVIADGNTLNWSFTPAAVGTYTAKLTVNDSSGNGPIYSSPIVITSNHVAPTVTISGATPDASRGDLFTLNLSAIEVGNEAVTSWFVNWGDGNTQTYSGNPTSVTHTYLSAGSVTISAFASDAYGNTNSNVINTAVGAGIYYDLASANHSATASINPAAAANVVDYNSSTEWTSGNVSSSPGQWVYVDLGAVYNISDVKLNWDTAYPGTYKIRISNDSCNWNDLTGVQNGAAGLADIPNLNGTGRYLLVQMLSLSSGNTGYALKDVFVFGSDDLATNRTVYASSNQSTAGNTLDTSNATEWQSTSAANQWIFMDLGEVYNIRTIKVNFDTDLPTQYNIYTSSDTTNWTMIGGTTTVYNGYNVLSGLAGNGRYVMLAMPSCANGRDIKVSDLEVNGSYDLSFGRPETASSNTSTAANAVDGNYSTAWTSSSSAAQTLYADLGAPYDVTRVTLNFGSSYPSAFQIQTSPDASNWTTIYSTSSFAGGTLDQGGIYGDGRYVRIYTTAGPGSYVLDEFTVYGSANLGLLRPMTASTAATNHGAGYASDQDPTSSWQSTAAGTQWLEADLGANYTVSNVTINFDAAYASNFTIYISSDNVNWTALTTYSGGHSGMNQMAGLSGVGRYVRLVMNSGPYGYYQVDDLYIYGH